MVAGLLVGAGRDSYPSPRTSAAVLLSRKGAGEERLSGVVEWVQISGKDGQKSSCFVNLFGKNLGTL